MEINVTAIERWVRQLGVPVAASLLGLVLVWAAEVLSGMPAVRGLVTREVLLGVGLIPLAGMIWAAWRVWQMYRWEVGELQGDCQECGGVLSHRTGKYGPYSQCRMCGKKREG